MLTYKATYQAYLLTREKVSVILLPVSEFFSPIGNQLLPSFPLRGYRYLPFPAQDFIYTYWISKINIVAFYPTCLNDI